MYAEKILIAWTPAEGASTFRPMAAAPPGSVAVITWPDRKKRSRDHAMTVGACNAEWREASDETRVALLFIAFHTMVVRDGIAPQAAHRALLAVDEYRAALAPDVEGAEDDDECTSR